jgi:hypothetical protein
MKLRLAAALALCASTTVAYADNRAWTVGKASLASGTVVVGINVSSVKSSELYQQFLPTLLAQAGDAKTNLDKIKTTCNIDVVESLDSVAISMDQDSQQGALVVAFKGVTEKDIDACAAKVSAADGKKVAITKDGAFMHYVGFGGDKDKDVYIKWLAKDVMAMSTKPDDKAFSAKALGGGVAKDAALKTPLAAVNTKAAIWGVVVKSQELDSGVHMKLAFGSLDVASGNLNANVHLTVDTAAMAKTAADKANDQLAELKKSGKLPPAAAGMVSSVKVASAGSDVVLTGSAPEKDVLGLMSMFGLGH